MRAGQRVAVARDEEIGLEVDGRRHPLRVKTPARLAEDAAMIIILGMDRWRTLDGDGWTHFADSFLAAGHRVASFDLPNHGDLVDGYGEGLTGMAAAAAAGVDPFEVVRRVGRAAVDACLERGFARPGRIIATGSSRGGFCALHVAAADARVGACVAMAPVTYLPALREFANLTLNPIVRKNNATTLIRQLAGRPVYIPIAPDDDRVSSERCLELFDALRAAAPEQGHSSFRWAEGDGHRWWPEDENTRAADWLLEGLATYLR